MMPSRKVLAKVAIAAAAWAMAGLALFDLIGIDLDGSQTQEWSLLTSPTILATFVIASILTWTGFTIWEYRKRRGNYLKAAILSPLIGTVLVSIIGWIFSGFRLIEFDPLTPIFLLFLLLAFSLLIWPISIGAALSCWAITWEEIRTTPKSETNSENRYPK